LFSCVIQLIIEVFFYETSECIMMHFIIPDLARNEVRSVGFALHQAVQTVWSAANADPPLLDAPTYLFVST
jgi:hypothetical protein